MRSTLFHFSFFSKIVPKNFEFECSMVVVGVVGNIVGLSIKSGVFVGGNAVTSDGWEQHDWDSGERLGGGGNHRARPEHHQSPFCQSFCQTNIPLGQIGNLLPCMENNGHCLRCILSDWCHHCRLSSLLSKKKVIRTRLISPLTFQIKSFEISFA